MIVVVPRRLERLHLRRAWRRYPSKEYLEALFGRREGGRLEICVFHEMPHTADRHACYYPPEMPDWIADEAAELGLKCLGTIHSHKTLKTCGHMSDCDIATHVEEGHTISGISYLVVSGGRRYGTVSYYCPWEPIQVEYV